MVVARGWGTEGINVFMVTRLVCVLIVKLVTYIYKHRTAHSQKLFYHMRIFKK